jgi:hypothetical protein
MKVVKIIRAFATPTLLKRHANEFLKELLSELQKLCKHNIRKMKKKSKVWLFLLLQII